MNASLAGQQSQALSTATTGFSLLAVALCLITGAGLWLTQSSWSLSSIGVFVPIALVGVLLVAILARSAARRAANARVDPPPPPHPIEAPSSADLTTSSPPDRYDDVDYLLALRHEFRTPLNAVLGFSDVLLGGIDGNINASQQEDLEIVRASGIRLRVLLDIALDLSQLATRDLRPDLEPVDARDIVHRAATEASQLWAGKRKPSVFAPDEPCLVRTDETRLRRSILVLADFLAANHRDAPIELMLDSSGGHVSVSVAAASSGRLTLDALPTSAEVLSSEDPMKIRRWPVAVTSEVIELHGGSLYHGDDPARFVIRLPAAGVS